MKKLEQHIMEDINGGKLCPGNCGAYTGFVCGAAVILLFTPFAIFSGPAATICAMGFTA